MKHSFLISIDDVLDTRLAIMASMFNTEQLELILASGYTSRLTEISPLWDREEFLEKYSQRNKLTLRAAIRTPVLGFIAKEILAMHESNSKSPSSIEPSIILNTHPYDLTDIEKGLFVAGLKEAIGGAINITIIDEPLLDITPSWLKASNVVTFINYHGEEWVNKHYANPEQTTLPDISLILPAIISVEHDDPSAPFLEQNGEPSLWDQYEACMSMRIGLVFTPAELWSSTLHKPKDVI